jgi:hypothetical protein
MSGNDSSARRKESPGGAGREAGLMASRLNTPSLIMRAFPGRDELIERAYRESGSFRDLCRDYRNCAAALDRWRRSDDATSSARAREYADLLGELEAELGSWFEACQAGGPGTNGRRLS